MNSDASSASAGGVQIHASRRLPDFLQSVNLKYVKLGYHYLMTHFLTLLLVLSMAVIIVQASQMNPEEINQLWLNLNYNLVSVIIFSAFLVFVSTARIMTRPRSVYLVDYSCYKPPEHLQVKFHRFMEHSKLTGDFDESSLEFQRKILERSGLGEETFAPEAIPYLPPDLGSDCHERSLSGNGMTSLETSKRLDEGRKAMTKAAAAAAVDG